MKDAITSAFAVGAAAGYLLSVVIAPEQSREPIRACRPPTDTYEVVTTQTYLRSDGALIDNCESRLDLYALHRDYTR